MVEKDTYKLKKGFTAAYRKSAFTLAEVLITLGIIGVVAAMTLPTLVNDKQNKELQTQFKKLITNSIRLRDCFIMITEFLLRNIQIVMMPLQETLT